MNLAAVRLALLAAVAGAVLLTSAGTYLPLGDRGRAAAEDFLGVVGSLPAGSSVLVAFDADAGTYPEIVYATRSVIRRFELARHEMAFVSFTPEGRALAVGELDRLSRDADLGDAQIRDLGYRAGAEAALARSIGELDVASFDLILLIGGIDLGPRAWVEQVQPRLSDEAEPQMVAIAPSFLLPELEPYRASGQLAAVLDNPRDALTLAGAAAPDDVDSALRLPSEAAILVGLLGALGILVAALIRTGSERVGVRGNRGAGR
ncbi:MAG: hypothetical protein ABR509_08530 [Candidatus Limnocylindria bacterium]